MHKARHCHRSQILLAMELLSWGSGPLTRKPNRLLDNDRRLEGGRREAKRFDITIYRGEGKLEVVGNRWAGSSAFRWFAVNCVWKNEIYSLLVAFTSSEGQLLIQNKCPTTSQALISNKNNWSLKKVQVAERQTKYLNFLIFSSYQSLNTGVITLGITLRMTISSSYLYFRRIQFTQGI